MFRFPPERFHRLCAQYQGLSILMLVAAGGVMVVGQILIPDVLWSSTGRGNAPLSPPAALIPALPYLCYFLGVWIIGRAMGRLSRGAPPYPALAQAMRHAGLALGAGGLLSVFGVTNLLRLMGQMRGGYLYFDVAGMTLGMVGGALFLLGQVMAQAGRLQAELDEIV